MLNKTVEAVIPKGRDADRFGALDCRLIIVGKRNLIRRHSGLLNQFGKDFLRRLDGTDFIRENLDVKIIEKAKAFL